MGDVQAAPGESLENYPLPFVVEKSLFSGALLNPRCSP